MKSVDVLEPISISSILLGAMMPYAFSALTMKSVGSAASKMVILFKNSVIKLENKYNKTIMILKNVLKFQQKPV
jgi:Na+/H+-translocating membrane pyrophosphatase